jgi:hypothetical protein
MKIKLNKIAEVPEPDCRASSWDRHVPGQCSDGVHSLPIDYEIVGYLNTPIKVGQPIDVNRTERNGVEIEGHFVSTPVQRIDGTRITTRNSIYHLIPVP